MSTIKPKKEPKPLCLTCECRYATVTCELCHKYLSCAHCMAAHKTTCISATPHEEFRSIVHEFIKSNEEFIKHSEAEVKDDQEKRELRQNLLAAEELKTCVQNRLEEAYEMVRELQSENMELISEINQLKGVIEGMKQMTDRADNILSSPRSMIAAGEKKDEMNAKIKAAEEKNAPSASQEPAKIGAKVPEKEPTVGAKVPAVKETKASALRKKTLKPSNQSGTIKKTS